MKNFLIVAVACYWAQCTATPDNSKPLSGCWKYGKGTKVEMLAQAANLSNKTGNFFFTECAQDGKFNTGFNWNRRVTGVPMPE